MGVGSNVRRPEFTKGMGLVHFIGRNPTRNGQMVGMWGPEPRQTPESPQYQ
jgi:hypothetical protein